MPSETEAEFTTRLINELRAAIEKEGPDNIAAFIAEPIMGCAGAVVPPADYFKQVQAVLREYNILFICDEVMCGYGRTGTFFGHEHYGVEPDILTSAKGLTSGYFPFSAVFISEKVMNVLAGSFDNLGFFAHVFTTSGHPIGASVALETLAQIEKLNILDNVNQRGQQLKRELNERLGSHPNIGDIRGEGLLLGIQFVKDKDSNTRFLPRRMPFI